MAQKPKVPKPPKGKPLFRMRNPASFEAELDVYGLLVDMDGQDGKDPEAQRKKLLRMYRKRKPAKCPHGKPKGKYCVKCDNEAYEPLAALRDKVVKAAVRAVKGYGGFAKTFLSLDGHAAKLIRAVRAYRAAGGK